MVVRRKPEPKRSPRRHRKHKPPLEVSESIRSLNAYGVTSSADHDAVYQIVGDSPNMVSGERRIASSDYAKMHRAAAKGYKKLIGDVRANRKLSGWGK